MIRWKKNLVQLFLYLFVLLIIGEYTPLFAGRRDWIKRQREHKKVAMNQHDGTLPEKSLSKFLGVPQEIIPPISSIAGLLGVPEEQLEEAPIPEKSEGQQNKDLYDITTEDEEVPLPEGEQKFAQEDSAHEVLEALNAAEPIQGTQDTGQEAIADMPIQDEDEIELYFENADLQNFVEQIEDVFDIKFILDDAIDPLPQGARSLKGNKISYRTHKPISRQKAWNTFNTFLNIAGFAVVPQPDPRLYRISSIARAQKSPLTTYIGIVPEMLPDSDELIRYVYFIENNTLDTIKTVVEQFRSSASTAVYLNEHRGFILTDIAYNIKKLMEIIKELDKVVMPESLSILKLRRADAKQVKELYDTLTQQQQDQQNKFGPRATPKKQPGARSLPENVTIVAEQRTNSLILLGPKYAREHIEDFIIKNIDVELDQAYSPLHNYQLRYANAQTVAEIMNGVTKFGADTEAGKNGGVRGGDQYLRPMTFVAEPATNQIIVRGHYDDYLKSEKIMALLDQDQPQVAIEVLILSIDASDTRQLGAQLRSKIDNAATNAGGWDGLLGRNVKFQTSGLFAGNTTTGSGIVQNTNADTNGVQRLLGNLINLVVGAPAGNTIITLGQDALGVWGIFQLFETITTTQLVSNPFLIATNKTPAEVSLGQTRRVATATVVGATAANNINAMGNESANLVLLITPQITSDGMIVMDIDITLDTFTSTNLTDPTKNTNRFKTSAILANKQVLALGGLVRHEVDNLATKVPILGDIPILGWFFKNRSKVQDKQNLLILISARIVEPTNEDELKIYNNKHIAGYQDTLHDLKPIADGKDPIHSLFFSPQYGTTEKEVDNFIFDRKKQRHKKTRVGRMKEKKRKDAVIAQLFSDKPSIAHVEPVQNMKMPAQSVPQRSPIVSAPAPISAPKPVGRVAQTSKPAAQPKMVSPAPKLVPKTAEASSPVLTTLQEKSRKNLSITDMLHNTTRQGATT